MRFSRYIAGILFAIGLACIGHAWALMPNAAGPLLKSQSTSSAVTITYHNQIVGASGTGTFGAAAAGRIIAVGVDFSLTSGGTFTGITINSVAGTRRQRATVVGGGSSILGSDIWTATVPSGTSGTVSVTTTNLSTMSMAVASIYNAASEGGTSGTNVTGAGTTNVSASLAIPSLPNSGVGIGNAFCNAGGATTISWTNLTAQLNSNWTTNVVHGFATSSTPGALTRTETCGTSGTQMLVVNAWGP